MCDGGTKRKIQEIRVVGIAEESAHIENIEIEDKIYFLNERTEPTSLMATMATSVVWVG